MNDTAFPSLLLVWATALLNNYIALKLYYVYIIFNIFMKGNKKLWILGMDVFGDGQAFDFFLRVKDDSVAADGPLVDAA